MVLGAALQQIERRMPRLSPRIAGMSTRAQAAFDRRFRREVAGSDGPGEGFVQRSCSQCSRGYLDYARTDFPLCFTCSHARNPYAAKNIRMSIEAEPQPSDEPRTHRGRQRRVQSRDCPALRARRLGKTPTGRSSAGSAPFM